jgi:outer membrane protein
VMLAAKRAVFDVLQADELIRIAEARVQRAREGVEAATRRMEVGSGTRSDVLRAGLELTNAQQSLLQARSQRRTAAFALGRLVGESGPVGARLTEPLQPRPLAYSREELLQLVLEQAPSVRSAVAAQRAADASVRSARAQYLPTLSASASYNLVNQEVDFRTANKSWSIGAGISYPIFNRFQREDAVARANVQADIARVQLEDAKRQARAEFERVMAGLELAEQQIALAEEAVQAAEEDLRMQEERYRLGVATIIDRVTSQLNLVQAEVDRIAARYAYQLARAELEALVGRSL